MSKSRAFAVPVALLFLASAALFVGPRANALPGVPPLATSSNVHLIGNVPTGPALGMDFETIRTGGGSR